MKRVVCFLTVCLLACTLGFAQDAPAERNLPQIQPAQCSVPAQVQGEGLVDEIIADIEEADRYVQGVQGGCGSWDLTKKQKENLGNLLAKDMLRLDPDAECRVMNSTNEKIPFGTSAVVGCSRTFVLDEDTSIVGHLVIGVRSDADGEVVIVFVSAGE